MKTKLLLILCLNAVQLCLSAQNKSELNWQDFLKSTKQTEIAKPVQNGEFTIFQIKDINKFLYQVQIEGKVFELQTPIPTELQALFRLKPEDLEKTATNKKVAEGVEEGAGAVTPMKAIADAAKNKVAKTNIPVNTANEALQVAEQAFQKSPNKANTAKVNTAKENLIEAEKQNAVQTKLQKAAEIVVLECTDYLELAKAVANNIFELKKARNKFISIAQMDASSAKIKAMVGTVTWPIPNIESTYLELRELYKKLDARYEELKAKAKTAVLPQEELDKIDESLDKIENANDLIEEEALLGLLNDVEFLYSELGNENNFKAVAPPVQMDGDMVSYTVTITPANTRTLGAFKSPMNFQFNIPTRGGLKVDFSVGPVFSFGKKAKDERYFFKQTGTADISTLEKRENNNVFVPTIAAMMHFYSRGTRLGGMLGVGAGFQSTDQLNANVFLGPSYIMGKRQKLMISGGCSFLRVDRLKDTEYKSGDPYNTTKVLIADVTEKVFKPSLFLAISYNLTNKVEIK